MPLRWNRSVAVTALLFLFVVSVLLALPRGRHSNDKVLPHMRRPELPFPTSNKTCGADHAILVGLHTTPDIEYRRRCIRVVPSENIQRTSLQNESRHLFPKHVERYNLTNIKATDCRLVLPSCQGRLNLQVPVQVTEDAVDTSTLLFGAATSLERLNLTLIQMSRWLGNTHTRLVVVVSHPGREKQFPPVESHAASLGIDITLVSNTPPKEGPDSEIGQASQHFAISRALYEHRSESHRWFVVIEDDTFFPSLPVLAQTLSSYDPAIPWYLGALSEDERSVKSSGNMAYGGAGIILSLPVLETLERHYNACMTTTTPGDALYRDCIYRYSSPTVQFTRLPGLHQLDMKGGDLSGFYESGLKPLLSIHHYNSYHVFLVHYAHIIADIAGSKSFLQRYLFGDDAILTNGYSIAQYPFGVADIDLNLVEQTFDVVEGQEHMFDSSLGHLRPKLQVGLEKNSWILAYTFTTDEGNVRQFYVKRANNWGVLNGAEPKPDSVFELDWSR